MIKPDKVVLNNRKSLTLKIDRKGRLIVYAPKNMSLDKIFKFILDKEKWIKEKQNQIKNSLNLNNDLFNFEQILFLGKKYPVIFIKNQEEIELTESALVLPNKIGFSNTKLTNKLKNWYIQNAELILIKRCKDLLKHVGQTYKSISIINSRAKWGMCDNKQNIYLNYKLLFLSHNLIDYVILHEITHLTELNHSKNFYIELKRILPNFKERQQELKKCGFLLNLLTE